LLPDLRRERDVSKSKITLFFCLLFIGGIFLASFQSQVLNFNLKLLIYLIVFFIFFFLLAKKTKYILILCAFLSFFLGVIRYQSAYAEVYQNQLIRFNTLRARIVGRISSEPLLKNNGINFIVSPQEIVVSGKELKLKRVGKILVITRAHFPYKYGDIIYFKGKLTIPRAFDDFNYRMFLGKDDVYSIFYYPKIKIISPNPTNSFYSFIFAIKSRLRKVISHNFLANQALILRAIILGDKNYLTSDLKNKLNIVGIRHIVSISGMHIVIIESILMALLLGLGFWRNEALYFTLFFSFIFIILTGFQISAIRAWIMASFYVVSSLIGRKSNSFRFLIFTAFLMLVYNPLILRYDISFQLSFSAVAGIIYFTPLFNHWLKFIPNRRLLNLRDILSMTLSAQVATFPLLIHYFGHISLIAPLTNILIIPILPLLISFGVLSSFLSLLWPLLGHIFSFPCWFFLTYMEGIINFFSRFRFYLKINMSPLYILVLYSFFVFVVWRYNKLEKLKFLNY